MSDSPAADRFELKDVFELEFASDPQVSPDGKRVVYVRNSMDVMTDRRVGRLWTVAAGSDDHRPLGVGAVDASLPRWSPDGKRLAFTAKDGEQTQLFMHWLDGGQSAKLTQLQRSPSHLAWSPDGKWLAFTMLVPEKPEPYFKLPEKPEGAEWAEPPKVIQQLRYRYDGQGYLEEGYHHVFVIPADGGTPRQLTTGPYHHDGPLAWSVDSQSLVFAANRRDDADHHPVESDLYEVAIASREIKQLTDRVGPDEHPVMSPDGKWIAYLGFDDRKQGYQVTKLSVMSRDGSDARVVSNNLDRDVDDMVWTLDGEHLIVQYDDHGVTKLGWMSLSGELTVLAEGVGGTTLGRPYASGSFSYAMNTVAFTQTSPSRPADVAVVNLDQPKPKAQLRTHLNDDLFGHKQIASVELFEFPSSFDNRTIESWIAKPPGFDSSKKYPLILEIHGGPFANYGYRFSSEIQLYAAAGYVVLYVNPRGSTSYGQEFGNLIHHKYPGDDYHDLMSGVDALIKQGYIDESQLYVTGGSGGGILTSWIVGKTDRFRAAVSVKPVINWHSFVLTADAYTFFHQYWFSAPPWENPEEYRKRSPLSLVGNVKTPTMIMTGEADHRTPISESEQFYQALKIRKVKTALVRVPGASHNIAARPSHLMAKVACVLKWFQQHAE